MQLSEQSISLISDLINIRLGDMLVLGREDLSEVVGLRRALAEVHGVDPVASGLLKKDVAISLRGRRRKVTSMIEDGV